MLGRGGTPSGRQGPAGLRFAWVTPEASGSAPAAPPAAGVRAGSTTRLPLFRLVVRLRAFRRCMGLFRAAVRPLFLRSSSDFPQLRPYRHGSSPFPEPVWLRLVQRMVLQKKATSFFLPRRRMCGEENRNGPFLQTGVPVQDCVRKS